MRLLEGGFLLTAKSCVRLWRLTVSGDGEGGILIPLALAFVGSEQSCCRPWYAVTISLLGVIALLWLLWEVKLFPKINCSNIWKYIYVELRVFGWA